MSSDLGTCDAARCGARAYVAAISPTTAKMIVLCSHHFGKSEQKLAEAKWIIEDWRQELQVTR
jgi:hypothetical protein